MTMIRGSHDGLVGFTSRGKEAWPSVLPLARPGMPSARLGCSKKARAMLLDFSASSNRELSQRLFLIECLVSGVLLRPQTTDQGKEMKERRLCVWEERGVPTFGGSHGPGAPCCTHRAGKLLVCLQNSYLELERAPGKEKKATSTKVSPRAQGFRHTRKMLGASTLA